MKNSTLEPLFNALLSKFFNNSALKTVLDRVFMHEEDSEYDACWEVPEAWQRGMGPQRGGAKQ